MLETMEAWSGIVLLIITFSILISVIFMAIGAKIIKIQNIRMRNIFHAGITASILTFSVAVIGSALPFVDAVIGFGIGLFIALFVIIHFINTTLEKTLIVWILNITGQIAAVLICSFLFIGGIKDFLTII